MKEFLKVVTPDRVVEILGSFDRLSTERVCLDEATRRVLSKRIISPENLPPLARATMDGYAVKAEDTFGATESFPTLLQVVEAVRMGIEPHSRLQARQAAAIPTGGILPAEADAVVMIEYSAEVGDGTVEITRPVTRGENVIGIGEDVTRGETIMESGSRVQPQDIGLLAGLGITEVDVYNRPKAVVLSTGDELIPVEQHPEPGTFRDINSHALAALIDSAGCQSLRRGIVPDEAPRQRNMLEQSLLEGDLVVISGGSSVGERDMLVEVISSLASTVIEAHGVAISPGKPTLIARSAGKAIFGLPGHPVSAMTIAQVFLVPFLGYLQGEAMRLGPLGPKIRANLATSIHSPHGRQEYVRVILEPAGDRLIARPIYGKSGMISSLARADGYIVVPIHAEGIPAESEVEVVLIR